MQRTTAFLCRFLVTAARAQFPPELELTSEGPLNLRCLPDLVAEDHENVRCEVCALESQPRRMLPGPQPCICE
jgi:hypothetical protein